MRTPRTDAIDIFHAGVRAADVPSLVPLGGRGPGTLGCGGVDIPASGLRRIVVVGAGKAGTPLARAVADWLVLHGPAACDVSGLALVPAPEEDPNGAFASTERWTVTGSEGRRATIESVWVRQPNDNAPTDAAVAATLRVLDLARGLGPDDLLICALSGGGSATLCMPAPGLTLAAKQEAVALLTADGATIAEINTLRRHLSDVKGGRLAEAASGARGVISVLVSDVDGDLPHVIASGPAVPDPTTFRDALGLREEWPPAVLRHLQAGCRGETAATPNSLPANVAWAVVLSPDDALRGAVERAEERGWRTVVLPRPTPSNLRACAWAHLDAVRRATDGTAILSVGEAPLELPFHPPDGGRAGHLALAIAVAADADPLLRGRVTALVGATDGEDGTSATSGGLVDGAVLRHAQDAGLDPARLLESCDSLSALAAGGGTLPGHATGTNVQDLRVILVGAPPGDDTD